jgi:methyltransferase (TIGR00027 family)
LTPNRTPFCRAIAVFENWRIHVTAAENHRSDATTFVPFSARLTAAMRAQETARDDSLFEDDFAHRLAGPEAFKLLEEQFTAQDTAYLAVRTRYFDDFILAAMAEARQIVILAAGMDTRAFRLSLPPDATVYELDQPEVLAHKAAILQTAAPACRHCAIAADLSQDWKPLLLAQGYRTDLPSIWLLEGLLMYLTQPVVHTLFSTLSGLLSPGSKLGLDTVNLKGLEYEPFKGYFRFGMDRPEAFLADYGWQATVKQPGEQGADFGRFPNALPPRDVPDVARIFLVTAEIA